MWSKRDSRNTNSIMYKHMIVIDDSILVNTMTDKILPIDETKLTIRGVVELMKWD